MQIFVIFRPRSLSKVTWQGHSCWTEIFLPKTCGGHQSLPLSCKTIHCKCLNITPTPPGICRTAPGRGGGERREKYVTLLVSVLPVKEQLQSMTFLWQSWVTVFEYICLKLYCHITQRTYTVILCYVEYFYNV